MAEQTDSRWKAGLVAGNGGCQCWYVSVLVCVGMVCVGFGMWYVSVLVRAGMVCVGMVCVGMCRCWYGMCCYDMFWYGMCRYGICWYGMCRCWYVLVWVGVVCIVSMCQYFMVLS